MRIWLFLAVFGISVNLVAVRICEASTSSQVFCKGQTAAGAPIKIRGYLRGMDAPATSQMSKQSSNQISQNDSDFGESGSETADDVVRVSGKMRIRMGSESPFVVDVSGQAIERQVGRHAIHFATLSAKRDHTDAASNVKTASMKAPEIREIFMNFGERRARIKRVSQSHIQFSSGVERSPLKLTCASR